MTFPFTKLPAVEEQIEQWQAIDVMDLRQIQHKSQLNYLCENERQFQAFLTANRDVQRLLGWAGIVVNQLRYPDLVVMLDNGDKLRVELEYEAASFIAHKHPANGCDLIVSLVRHHAHSMLKGIPVWSLFRSTGKNTVASTLGRDVKLNGYEGDISFAFDD